MAQRRPGRDTSTECAEVFQRTDVADFQQYLSERNWNGHDVFVDQDHGVVGCASFYAKSVSVVGLAWMFFRRCSSGAVDCCPNWKNTWRASLFESSRLTPS